LKKYKSDFNIEQIGRFRFYSGLIIGLIFSLILNQFFLNLIQLSDVLSAMSKGYWETPFSEKTTFYYSFFWSLFSISLAFSFTSYLWTSKPTLKNRRETRMNRIAQTNSLFIFGLIFLSISRLLQFYIEFHYVDYEIKEEVGNLLFILPIFIFAFNWIYVSRIYKSTKPFLISLLIFVIYGLILSGIKT
jgi:uncharacterized membrane protein